MDALDKYLEEKNFWAKITGGPIINRPVTEAEIRKIEDWIDCDLSPENLTCDGELSSRAVDKRYTFLDNVQRCLTNIRNRGRGERRA